MQPPGPARRDTAEDAQWSRWVVPGEGRGEGAVRPARHPALCLGPPAREEGAHRYPALRPASLPSSPGPQACPPALARGPGVLQAGGQARQCPRSPSPAGATRLDRRRGGPQARPHALELALPQSITPEGPEERSRVAWQGDHGPVRAAHARVCGQVADSCHRVARALWIRAQWGRKGPRQVTHPFHICLHRQLPHADSNQEPDGAPRGTPGPLRLSPGSGSVA